MIWFLIRYCTRNCVGNVLGTWFIMRFYDQNWAIKVNREYAQNMISREELPSKYRVFCCCRHIQCQRVSRLIRLTLSVVAWWWRLDRRSSTRGLWTARCRFWRMRAFHPFSRAQAPISWEEWLEQEHWPDSTSSRRRTLHTCTPPRIKKDIFGPERARNNERTVIDHRDSAPSFLSDFFLFLACLWLHILVGPTQTIAFLVLFCHLLFCHLLLGSFAVFCIFRTPNCSLNHRVELVLKIRKLQLLCNGSFSRTKDSRPQSHCGFNVDYWFVRQSSSG